MVFDPERAAAIFDRALDIDPAERPDFLSGACGNDVSLRRRVEDLLMAHEAESGFLPSGESILVPAVGAERLERQSVSMGSPITETPGAVIGRYRLLEKLGEGGFGAVWVAEQREPVTRRVALKIIKLGMDTKQVIARFEAERQALALMDHPNIAKVLDAGATETRPALLRHGTGARASRSPSTATRTALHPGAARPVHPGLPGHPARAPEGDHPPRHQAVEHPGHAARRRAGAEGDRLRHRQGDRAGRLTDKTLYTQFAAVHRHAGLHEPGAGGDERAGHRHAQRHLRLGVLLYELLTGRTPFDAKELMRPGLDEMRRIIREQEPLRPEHAADTLGKARLHDHGRRRRSRMR